MVLRIKGRRYGRNAALEDMGPAGKVQLRFPPGQRSGRIPIQNHRKQRGRSGWEPGENGAGHSSPGELTVSGSFAAATVRGTVRAGEESGDLLSSFRRMADYFARMNKTRESVVSALTYPAFVSFVAVIVVSVIMGYAVPTFTSTFESMSIDLPWITRTLIAVSRFFQKYTLLLIVLTVLVFGAVRFYGTTKRGGPRLARAQLHIPVIGGIVRMSGASQFAHTMSALLAAGMPLSQAIEVSGRTMMNLCLSGKVLSTLPGVESGRPLGECMSYAKELPPMLIQMTAMGEATGSMEYTLEVLAEYYDNETDVRAKRALIQLCQVRGAGADEFCFVDLGRRFTRITLVWRDRVQATRQIAPGGQDLEAAAVDHADAEPLRSGAYRAEHDPDVLTLPATAEVCDRIAVEILKVINFYRFTYRSGTLNGIYLVGGGAVLPLLDEAVGATADMEWISISGDTAQLRFYDVTLTQTSRIVRALEDSPIVAEITVNTALTLEETPPEVSAPVQVNILIQLQKEAAE